MFKSLDDELQFRPDPTTEMELAALECLNIDFATFFGFF